LQNSCKRLLYEEQHGRPAPDTLCPNGFRYRSFQKR
jgi:hypothetical protein